MVFSVIPEPWTSQISFLMTDEALAGNKDEVDAEVDTVDEEGESEDE